MFRIWGTQTLLTYNLSKRDVNNLCMYIFYVKFGHGSYYVETWPLFFFFFLKPCIRTTVQFIVYNIHFSLLFTLSCSQKNLIFQTIKLMFNINCKKDNVKNDLTLHYLNIKQLNNFKQIKKYLYRPKAKHRLIC